MKNRYSGKVLDTYRLCSRRRWLYVTVIALIGLLIFITYVSFSLPTSSSGNQRVNAEIIEEEFNSEGAKKMDKSLSPSSEDGNRRVGLVAAGKHFTLNGEKIQIFSGAMHYFRIPHDYWFDRLVKLKAAGLNTVETYVAWNMHEQQPGQFDFSGQLDLVRYINLAKELGLYVIVRPGPYICAEWDWGGLPAWLLEDPKMKIRSTYKGYTEAVDRYFSKLIPRLAPLQYGQGGNIIAVQIENEYGAYDGDKEYLAWCKDVLIKHGITELLFTSDGGDLHYLQNGSLPGIFSVVNFQRNPDEAFAVLESFQPNKPLMVGEFWTGWFDHWGEQRHVLALSNFTETLESIVSRGASVNFYMFHGGTNFGFMNGANVNRTGENLLNKTPPYMPTITSYDYDAPLSEAAEITPKYNATMEILKKYNPKFNITPEEKRYVESKKPDIKSYGELNCQHYLTLTDVLTIIKPMGVIERPINVENLCQQIAGTCSSPLYGFVAYEYKGDFSQSQKLSFNGVLKDRMQIIMDGKLLTTVYAKVDNYKVSTEIQLNETGHNLLLLVENMGRVNYDKIPNKLDNHRKGFMGSVYANDIELKQWSVYDLSLKPNDMNLILKSDKWEALNTVAQKQPSFYRFSLDLPTGGDMPADTFVNVQGWNKGVLFVNNKNLGRYWKKGPAKTLYLPGPYLNRGENALILFELHDPAAKITLQQTADLGKPCLIPCYNTV